MKRVIMTVVIMTMLIISSASFSFANTEMLQTSDYEVSEAMTYEELIQYHAEKYGLTFEDAEQEVNPNGDMPQTQTQARGASTSYRTLSISLSVTSTYKPRLEFYVVTDNWNSYWVIDHIYYITLVREYNGISKTFAGDIACWYRGNNKVEYSVNGDFYNNGTTNASANVNIGAGENASFNIGVGYSSGHYKYFYVHDTKTWAGN